MTTHRAAPTNPLQRAVLGPHATIDHLARQSLAAGPGGDPREGFELLDAFMSVVSRHLAAIEDVVLPAARRRVESGDDRVGSYLHDARALERCVHLLKARSYGDALAHDMDPDALWREVDELLARHASLEQDLVDDLSAEMPDDESARLAERVLAAGNAAPTRPHPITPHSGVLGRVAHRAWRIADSLWDTAEGRVIPHPRKPAHPRRDSLLTRYVMGAPDFDETGGTESKKR